MILEDIEKLCILLKEDPTNWIHLGESVDKVEDILPKLLAVAQAAKDMVKHGEVVDGSDNAWMNNLDWALRELEKE